MTVREFDYPGSEDGERTMRFVEAALKSNREESVYVSMVP